MVVSRKTGHQRASLTQIGERSNRVGADFLTVDAQVALTFTGIALGTSDPEKKKRTTHVARLAYNTILRLMQHIELSRAEGNTLDATLQRLKSELLSLGESL